MLQSYIFIPHVYIVFISQHSHSGDAHVSPNERPVCGSRHCRNVDLVDLTTASPRLGPFHKLQIEHLEDVFLNFGEVKIVWCQVGWYGG